MSLSRVALWTRISELAEAAADRGDHRVPILLAIHVEMEIERRPAGAFEGMQRPISLGWAEDGVALSKVAYSSTEYKGPAQLVVDRALRPSEKAPAVLLAGAGPRHWQV
jgi:hypothetical protein